MFQESLKYIARAYAQALFRFGNSRGQESLEKLVQCAQATCDALESNPKLAQFIEFSTHQSLENMLTLVDVFKSIDTSFATFLTCVIQNRRLFCLHTILYLFLEYVDNARGITKCTIRSATPLTPHFCQQINEMLEAHLHKKFNSTYITDEKLLGGFTVEADGIKIDTSLQCQLATLRNYFLR